MMVLELQRTIRSTIYSTRRHVWTFHDGLGRATGLEINVHHTKLHIIFSACSQLSYGLLSNSSQKEKGGGTVCRDVDARG